MKLRVSLWVLLVAVCFLVACSSRSPSNSVTTAGEAVSKAKLAWKQIYDKASWHKIYSQESTAKFEPYTATLVDDVWIVKGTVPEGYKGEVVESTVRQSDGSVAVDVVVVK